MEARHQDCLLNNWAITELAADWQIVSEPGDPERGIEFPTGVGRIDILAKHRRESRWLVIELKRGETSDVAVGQVLRYIGWVRRNVAQPGERVEGLVIAHDADDALRYALDAVPDLGMMLYEIEFRLRDAVGLA